MDPTQSSPSPIFSGTPEASSQPEFSTSFSARPVSERSNKKKIIIIAIVLLLLIVSISLAAAYIPKLFIPSQATITEAFDAYSECYLSEDCQNADKLYEGFHSLVSEESVQDEYTREVLAEYDTKYNFQKVYKENPLPVLPDLVAAYAVGGEASVRAILDSNLENFEPIGEIYGISYYQNLEDWSEQIILFIESYESAGCLVETEIDYDCAVKNPSEARELIADKISRAENNMTIVASGSEEDLTSYIPKIKNLLNERADDNE